MSIEFRNSWTSKSTLAGCFLLGARWNRLGEAVNTRKERENTGRNGRDIIRPYHLSHIRPYHKKTRVKKGANQGSAGAQRAHALNPSKASTLESLLIAYKFLKQSTQASQVERQLEALGKPRGVP